MRSSRDTAALSIDSADIARFGAQAGDWWNPDGAFRPLHRLNPTRLAYLRARIAAQFGGKATGRHGLQGLRLLDIGCGGGLLAEPLARLGAAVTGLDASAPAIHAAKAHAAQAGLRIDYRCGSVEALAKSNAQFDVVTALEIVEHVADRASFLRAVAQLVRPGGLLVMSTLNRTAKSWLLGIVAAEYVLGWVPRGTHDWQQFVRPSELNAELAAQGLTIVDLTGLVFNPLTGAFGLSSADLAVNYLLAAVQPAGR